MSRTNNKQKNTHDTRMKPEARASTNTDTSVNDRLDANRLSDDHKSTNQPNLPNAHASWHDASTLMSKQRYATCICYDSFSCALLLLSVHSPSTLRPLSVHVCPLSVHFPSTFRPLSVHFPSILSTFRPISVHLCPLSVHSVQSPFFMSNLRPLMLN